MMNLQLIVSRLITLTTITLISGCAGAYNPNGASALGAAANNSLMAAEGAALNSLTQSIAPSVVNGPISSQISPADQQFRLQQLGGLAQSGAINQSQQWVNPQTGNTLALNPVGQNTINPQTQQPCQNLEEVMTMPNGQSVRETRVACLDPQTGKWNLVQ